MSGQRPGDGDTRPAPDQPGPDPAAARAARRAERAAQGPRQETASRRAGARREASAGAAQMTASAARGASSAPVRVLRVWRALPHERRLAAAAALALFVTLFLPWYQETVIANGVSSLRSASASLTGWGAFSFVEAAVLLVAVGVLALLFIRAESGAFHVPGGDGGVITFAGVWTCALVIWRMFDKEGTSGHGQVATTSGIEWGIFVALAVAGLLTYAGTRIRLAHEPEPPLPGEPGRGPRPVTARRPRPDEIDLDDSWAHLSPRGSVGPAGSVAPGAAPGGVAPGGVAPEGVASAGAAPEDAVPEGAAAEGAAAERVVPASPGGGRVRPRSIGAEAEPSEAPTIRRRADPSEQPTEVRTDPVEAPTVRRLLDPADAATERRGLGLGADAPTERRRLDRREIAELDLADPPTAPLKRSAPPPRPDLATGEDDPLTLRYDGPR